MQFEFIFFCKFWATRGFALVLNNDDNNIECTSHRWPPREHLPLPATLHFNSKLQHGHKAPRIKCSLSTICSWFLADVLDSPITRTLIIMGVKWVRIQVSKGPPFCWERHRPFVGEHVPQSHSGQQTYLALGIWTTDGRITTVTEYHSEWCQTAVEIGEFHQRWRQAHSWAASVHSELRSERQLRIQMGLLPGSRLLSMPYQHRSTHTNHNQSNHN